MPDFQTELVPYLKKYFGFDRFRKQQEAIITAVLNKEDSLVIMPTGGGKSICFQLPALLFKGTTLVISPLIALMKDQVDGLIANGIPAAFFNSSQSPGEQRTILDNTYKGELKLLYVAPESLQGLSPVLKEEYISCVAVDEAHCISSWGHDFRPSYQQLGFLKSTLPQTPIIALTATADKATRQDILDQLQIPDARQFLASFNRENISLEVRAAHDRVSQILEFIAQRPDESGIIYCLSRKSTETLVEKICSNGIKAAAYHAGLDFESRNRVQEDFIFDKTQIVCATIAFGMGIDKSNVRWVVHYNMPKNIEGYYQEIGRSGRDGLAAHALLFHSYADVIQLQRFASGAANEEVQLAKLERMKQFSEASSCRRKILLSYFGEYLQADCGNCDVCKNPPQFFDGTVIAQKVLSTIARLKESEATGTVIDVLRGAQNANILDKNYQEIKTYGIGRDISWNHWQHYTIQLINQGLCEIAFHRNNVLQLTDLAKAVLFHNAKVQLSRPLSKEEQMAARKESKSKPVNANSLFEKLRRLRFQISLEENIPAYLVFNDASLREMESKKPLTSEAFKEINGVGQRKLEVYGEVFINEIKAFVAVQTKKQQKKTRKSDTAMETYELFSKGIAVEEIAEIRGLKPNTILAHLEKLYHDGKDIDIYQLITKEEVAKVVKAKKELQDPEGLKPYFEHFEEKMEYATIRLALSVIEREGKL
ncbi:MULTISPECIES: DNA helicase RecQ [unclassified Arenibacter]|uniref:DNA helicase RecQ n=1 Tax=unclassified Arenibacter TaxID=2615047 RepID=UPI000E34C689|nr:MULTISPECIES: DNA helicase RecQ [unclassified Arenibacter]MCM4163183.1 DNA helicase RecQ [Arenibacter sp. A80]RFT57208.1 DNA helicase RecQ [Arenibacter sp. P308M17]